MPSTVFSQPMAMPVKQEEHSRNRIMIQMINYIYTVNKYQQSTQIENQPPALGTEKPLGDFLHHSVHQEGHSGTCATHISGRWLHDQCIGQQGQRVLDGLCQERAQWLSGWGLSQKGSYLLQENHWPPAGRSSLGLHHLKEAPSCHPFP